MPTSRRSLQHPAGRETAMRLPAPTPTGSPLPLPPPRASHRRQKAGSIELSGEAIEQFNQLLHKLHPDAPHIDADAIASVARWLESQPPEQSEMILQVRLQRLDELQSLHDDPDWTLKPSQEQRIRKILEYAANDSGLIPNGTPALGRLDDALLIELVWPMLVEDLEDYRDFCRFREINADPNRRPIRQQDWLLARIEEGALWEQLHRVRDKRYVDYSPPTSVFRVI